jgi:copper homeostasis protein (lipoprotein)
MESRLETAPMSALKLPYPLLLAALLGLAACRGEPAPAPEAGTPPPGKVAAPAAGEHFEMSWQGVLPCADCDGIQTRLLLRADADGQRYELEETYLGEDTGNRFEQQGRWVQETLRMGAQSGVVYRLDPQGPSRWFWLQPDGGLEMLEGQDRPAIDGISYRLQRL